MNCTNTTFKFLIIRGAVLVIAGWCSACEAFLDIDPPKTEIINEVVFSNDASAVAAMRGIYSIMMTNQSFTNGSIERYTGLSSDELVDISNTDEQQEFYHNTLSTTNQVVVSLFWREAYLYISNANAVLEGLNASGSISPEIKQQLEGEAKFVRAFCQFYLVSLFGAVPYVTSTDYKINSAIARREIQDVYAMIVEDLNDAKALLSDDYSFSRNERSQPNRSAAAALLARVHLFAGDWASAESEATFVIDHTELYALPDDLNSVFLANSQEAIWQLQPVTPEKSTGQ
ncbi:MAG TPA: RagB/SusD family nutrient uptake outer membrane protein, partial [Ohtaekwangia sp.]|nr:RagB/SusD family nutrient uptake outer membrane protein [Ohtaekwangia sp.]